MRWRLLPANLWPRLQHSLLVTALLCVLLARAAVPAGWMPMASADGIVLAPCSGMGMMTLPGAEMPAAMDMPGMGASAAHQGDHDTERHPDPAGDHPCAGAGVSVALAAPLLDLFSVPSIAPAAAPVARLTPAIGRGLAAPPPPATGPPVLV
ncbi:hypothetical protein [Sphingomonas hylomeconis]|uniref:DUF2946 domain-containing protein n=1 Tax=Sphingomonas hylomeconis TaxID=1395958 RepID=A0ABV7SSQ4_9SPHN|nr:hypothetical protein [Sphingomonas hylomeconis]